MRTSVLGLGKLGSPLAACLASKGFSVIGVDVDPKVVESLNSGASPVFEPGLDELIKTHNERLRATDDTKAAVLGSEVTFVLVPTPSQPDGAFSLDYVLKAAEAIGAALKEKDAFHLVVLTSTVMPGDTESKFLPVLEKASGKSCGLDFGICYNPEFIALGTVIRDMLNPDMVLIGESDKRSGDLLESIYKQLCDNSPAIARMNFVNAELTKLSVNTFATTKISFANMVARLCERLDGGDVDVVTAALGLDTRIGRKYLTGAIGYGGPCFPRDNKALASLAQSLGAPGNLSGATHDANNEQIEALTKLVKSKLPSDGTVGIMGLAYKPDTDVVEQSAGLLLAQTLVLENIQVIAYDPVAMVNAQRVVGNAVRMAQSLGECVEKADLLVVTTPWREFIDAPAEVWLRSNSPIVVIDCWRALDQVRLRNVKEYVPLGRGRSGGSSAHR